MAEISTKSSAARQRVSNFINRKPAGNLYHAVRIAEAVGNPLQTFVTINFALTSCPAEAASEYFEALRADHFGPWVRRPSRKLKRDRDPCAYVWTFENRGNCVHLHWLLHVPRDRQAEFKTKLLKWLATLDIAVHDEAAVEIKHAYKPKVLSLYLLKGIDPPYAGFYGIKFHAPQGMIIGKRSGFSRSLGPAVKERLRKEGRYQRRRFVKWPGA